MYNSNDETGYLFLLDKNRKIDEKGDRIANV